ncbi:MAG TPA: rod shape-determining protein MreD [Anaerolineales bacterium]|jgi:rod shape-determining protein MreD
MGYLIGIPLLALLAVLQTTVLGRFRLLDGAPDLILLASVAWALTGRSQQAMALALIGGLLLDTLSGYPLGVSSIMLVLVAYLVSLSEVRFWEAHFLMPLAAVLLGSVVYYVGNLGVLAALGRSPDLGLALTRVILPGTFLNLVLALPASQAARAVEATLYPPEVGI